MARLDEFRGGAAQDHSAEHGFVYRDVIPPFERARAASAPSRRTLDLDTVLSTDQQTITRDKVDQIAATPARTGQPDHALPKVWGYGKDTWVEDGHHRIAAARQRGDTHIEVVHRRATGDIYADRKMPRR